MPRAPEPRVAGRRRPRDQRLDTPQAGRHHGQLQARQHYLGCVHTLGQLKAQHAAEAIGEQPACALIVGAALQPWVVHGRHLRGAGGQTTWRAGQGLGALAAEPTLVRIQARSGWQARQATAGALCGFA